MEKNKIYITDYINLFFKRKLLFSLITIITTIVLSLALYFGASVPKKKYNVTFSYSDTLVNTSLNYKNLVSSYYLNSAKEKNEEFESIEIDNILDYNLVSVSKSGEDDITYTLTLSAKAIRNESLARDYIQALLNLPIERLIEINSSNYHSNLNLIDSQITYESKIDFMKEQYNELNLAYTNLITNYKSSLKASDYNNLINKYNNFNRTFLNVDFDALKTESINNGYVLNFSEYKDSFYSKLVSKIDEYETINEKIKLINSTTYILDENYYTLLDSLYSTKSEVKSLVIKFLANSYSVEDLESTTKIENVYTTLELNNMKESINQTGFDTFKNKFDNLINSLKSSTSDVNALEKLMYSNIDVLYNNTNVIEISGNISTPIIVLVSLVLSLIVASLTVIIIDHKKLYNLS